MTTPLYTYRVEGVFQRESEFDPPRVVDRYVEAESIGQAEIIVKSEYTNGLLIIDSIERVSSFGVLRNNA